MLHGVQLIEALDLQAGKHAPAGYEKPEWSGAPNKEDFPFTIQVLKSGTFVDTSTWHDTVDVGGRELFMMGRLADTCDYVLEHPSISRQHAAIQFKADGAAYIYDLRTHGTRVNKRQLKPRVYAKLGVGDVIQLGQSSRLLIFQGPEELMPVSRGSLATATRLITFDHKMIKNHHHWAEGKHALGCGLDNLGNTCYMAAYLQVLARAHRFIERLLKLPATAAVAIPTLVTPSPASASASPSAAGAPAPASGAAVAGNAAEDKVVLQVQRLVSMLLLSARRSLRAEALLSSLPSFFQGGQQQDSCELGRYILSCVEGKWERAAKTAEASLPAHAPSSTGMSRMSGPAPPAHAQKKPTEIFQGKMLTHLTCHGCGSVSCRSEAFFDLTLPVPPAEAPAAVAAASGGAGAGSAGLGEGSGAGGAGGGGAAKSEALKLVELIETVLRPGMEAPCCYYELPAYY